MKSKAKHQTAGHEAAQTAGNYSTQTAGNYSTQTAGDESAQKAGNYSTQTAEPIEKKPVDKRNTLNDLNGTEWLPATKSYMYQKGLDRKL